MLIWGGVAFTQTIFGGLGPLSRYQFGPVAKAIDPGGGRLQKGIGLLSGRRPSTIYPSLNMNSSDNSAQHPVAAEKWLPLVSRTLGADRDTLLVMAAQHENRAAEAERRPTRPKLALND